MTIEEIEALADAEELAAKESRERLTRLVVAYNRLAAARGDKGLPTGFTPHVANIEDLQREEERLRKKLLPNEKTMPDFATP